MERIEVTGWTGSYDHAPPVLQMEVIHRAMTEYVGTVQWASIRPAERRGAKNEKRGAG